MAVYFFDPYTNKTVPVIIPVDEKSGFNQALNYMLDRPQRLTGVPGSVLVIQTL